MVIALKAYCDGSGSRRDSHSHYLTLSGLFAPPDAWEPFEREWWATLTAHKSPPWHSTDAFARKGEFSGWSLTRVKELRNDLFRRCFQAIADKEPPFGHARCTVNLDDWRRVATNMPEARKTPPEALCAYWIANSALGNLPRNETAPLGHEGEVELYFDRNERFMHHIQKQWEQRKGRIWTDIVSRIVGCFPVEYQRVAGIQAADFLAWHHVHALKQDDQIAQMMSDFACPYVFMSFDYDRLVGVYGDLASGSPR